jgi:hypothetical protein
MVIVQVGVQRMELVDGDGMFESGVALYSELGSDY